MTEKLLLDRAVLRYKNKAKRRASAVEIQSANRIPSHIYKVDNAELYAKEILEEYRDRKYQNGGTK